MPAKLTTKVAAVVQDVIARRHPVLRPARRLLSVVVSLSLFLWAQRLQWLLQLVLVLQAGRLVQQAWEGIAVQAGGIVGLRAAPQLRRLGRLYYKRPVLGREIGREPGKR